MEHHPSKAYPKSLVEIVEAAVLSGERALAEAAFEQLREGTPLSGTDWALGLEARSRALLASGPAAERAHCEAIERLGRTRVRVELARAHLLYGEWLRGERRRQEARDQLRTAHELCLRIGLDAFAERAADELLAAGETARKRGAETSDQLTEQEAADRPPGHVTASRTRRSVRACSSLPAPSNTTCARSSPTSASARATNSRPRWALTLTARRRSSSATVNRMSSRSVRSGDHAIFEDLETSAAFRQRRRLA